MILWYYFFCRTNLLKLCLIVFRMDFSEKLVFINNNNYIKDIFFLPFRNNYCNFFVFVYRFNFLC